MASYFGSCRFFHQLLLAIFNFLISIVWNSEENLGCMSRVKAIAVSMWCDWSSSWTEEYINNYKAPNEKSKINQTILSQKIKLLTVVEISKGSRACIDEIDHQVYRCDEWSMSQRLVDNQEETPEENLMWDPQTQPQRWNQENQMDRGAFFEESSSEVADWA